MDRQIIYPGQIPMSTDLLNTNKYTMIAVAKLAAAMLGTTTVVNGLGCVPTGPASLQVIVNPGEVYSLANVDGTAYGELAADTHSILKQGISMDAVTLSCPAPVTAGQSVNYLIQATYQDSDTGLVTLPYYNASNPSQAWSGPNNSGAQQATARKGIVNITAKAGVAATTGSQTTPAPDAGYTGLWVVTVANGQSTITAGNIAQAAGAPFLTETLVQKISQSTADARYLQISQASGRLLNVQVFTASGTYTPTAGMTFAIMRVQGGGGGGAGTQAPSAGRVSLGAPGGAGSFAVGKFLAAPIGASQAVTVGAAGAASSGAAGGNGGTSSVGALISSPGGLGGAMANSVLAPNGNGNGVASSAPSGANLFGSRGAGAALTIGFTTNSCIAGSGGASVFGPGGPTIGSGLAGNAAVGYGSGGSGSASIDGGGALAGGAGAAGIVIIEEYA